MRPVATDSRASHPSTVNPPLPDELAQYVPQSESTDEDWVTPHEGENWFQALNRGVREHIAETAKSSFIVGKLLRRIERPMLYVEGNFESMEDYLTDLVPELSVAWAYVLMSVSDDFQLKDAEKYGISPLYELIKLQGIAPEYQQLQPADLLVGTHEFADANGKPVELNVAAEHSSSHLKKLVAIARDAARARQGKPPSLSEAAKQLEAKVKAVAEQVPSAHGQVREKKHEVMLELHADTARMTELLKKIGEAV
jgi:hypothetical protein